MLMKTIVLLTKLHGFLPSELERMTMQDLRLSIGIIEDYQKQEAEEYARMQSQQRIT